MPFVSDGAINSGVITPGMLCYISTATGKVGHTAAGASLASNTANFGGVVGFAKNGTTAGDQPVLVEPIVGGKAYELQSFGSAPTLALMAAGLTTYYVIRNDAGVPKIDLATSTNGIAKPVNLAFTDGLPPVATTTGAYAPKLTGYAVGDNVWATFPEAVRHFK